MKEYNPIVYKLAIPELNNIIKTIRKLKMGEPWGKELFEKINSNEYEVSDFLDKIEKKYYDLISNPKYFGNLIADNKLSRNALGKVYKEYNSLDDFSRFTLEEFSKLPFAVNCRKRVLGLMVHYKVPLKDKTVDEIVDFLNLLDSF